MQYKRDFNSIIKSTSSFFPIIILTGARQTGKTTLLKSLYPDINYISLDLPSLAEKAENSPSEFLREFKPPIIIDEVQYAPKLFRHIKQYVDENRHEMGQFFLTGSQKFLLMKEVGDSLAGRAAWLELETLSYSEINSTNPYSADPTGLAHLITRGMFPELWRQPDLTSDIFYSTYLATYLERDVREILNVTSLRDFERFIRILAIRSGQLLNKSEVAKDVGVSVKAISDWISVLEASNQIVLLEPYFQNFSKRIIKNPKIYFNDTGLLSFLLKVSADNFFDTPFLGHLWETFIFSEIRKQNRVTKKPYNIFFYRDQRAREIDFFLERGGIVTLLESKWNENPGQREIKHIKKISLEITESKVPIKMGNSFVISSTPHSSTIEPQIESINLSHLIKLF
jgi:uncharacterized protein